MPAVLGKCEAQNESMASLYFSKNVEHMQKIKSRCNSGAKVYLSTWWHYMCAQKVLDCRDLGYYAQDANVALPFTTPGHDGVIMCAFHSRTPRLRAPSCSPPVTLALAPRLGVPCGGCGYAARGGDHHHRADWEAPD